jgi:DNA-directed RNA polymerase, mitochondrial
MTKLNGGYLTLRTDAVKATEFSNAHTSALVAPVKGAHLEALNHIQKTRWSINRDVLDVAMQCRHQGLEVPGFPSGAETPLPEYPSNLDKTSDEFKAHIRLRERIHNENARNAGMRLKLFAMLDMASDLVDFPALWFPHYADFRGRFYPRPQDLHTQGDSLVKGLLRFAEPVAMTERGWYWLRVNVANYFGEDKLPLDDRAKWTVDHLEGILAVATDPVNDHKAFEFWTQSDSPWEFLSACFEVKRVADYMMVNGTVEGFLSTAVCRYDATCSGIQHLAALMKDTKSAARVNVLSTGVRADIYKDVAEKVKLAIQRDVTDSRLAEAAALWIGKVERKTVKRAVMTTPYGVSERGILTQLVQDGFADHIENGKERYAAAEYLTGKIVDALDESIEAPRRAMGFFREVAAFLEERDLPLVWDTPSGFTAKQAYFRTTTSRIRTLHGDVTLRHEEPAAGFQPGKQVLGAAPNVVHSFDAAHLALVCVAMRDAGVRDLAFVHDSFGCHAEHSDLLLKITKDKFVEIYSGDTLEQWRQSVMKHSGCLDVPKVPMLGSLTVEDVHQSEFFFS